MNKINEEYYKQKIGWYRHLFTVFSAITIGCAAWLVASYDKVAQMLIYLDLITIFAVTVSMGVTVTKIRKYIKLLRE